MNEKVLRKLEYHKIMEQLEKQASSEPGKERCRSLLPMTDLEAIEEAQTHTSHGLSRLFKKGRIYFSGNTKLKGLLRSLEIGSILSSQELLKIADSLECANRIKTYGRPERQKNPKIL